MEVRKPYRTTFNKDNVISTGATVALTAGEWTQIGAVTIPAGTAYAIGYGGMEGQDSAAGRFYADFKDNSGAPVAINGMLRVEIKNPLDRTTETIWEGRTEILRSSATDRTQQLPMPIINSIPTEDWKIVFMLKGDATATLSRTNSTVYLDATQFEAYR